jgi:hypothetical protein
MTTVEKSVAALFVDQSRQQWIVRDPEGKFWILPSVENPWEQRQPFDATADLDLEPVPGHYKDLLGLPF